MFVRVAASAGRLRRYAARGQSFRAMEATLAGGDR
jgi:hypothetical protein